METNMQFGATVEDQGKGMRIRFEDPPQNAALLKNGMKVISLR